MTDLNHPRVAEVAAALALAEADPPAFWHGIDSNAWWAGVGSLAAETLMDNPGLPDPEWQRTVRELRELLIEVGQALLTQPSHNPGISSWLLAFRSWNDSGV